MSVCFFPALSSFVSIGQADVPLACEIWKLEQVERDETFLLFLLRSCVLRKGCLFSHFLLPLSFLELIILVSGYVSSLTEPTAGRWKRDRTNNSETSLQTAFTFFLCVCCSSFSLWGSLPWKTNRWKVETEMGRRRTNKSGKN